MIFISLRKLQITAIIHRVNYVIETDKDEAVDIMSTAQNQCFLALILNVFRVKT